MIYVLAMKAGTAFILGCRRYMTGWTVSVYKKSGVPRILVRRSIHARLQNR